RKQYYRHMRINRFNSDRPVGVGRPRAELVERGRAGGRARGQYRGVLAGGRHGAGPAAGPAADDNAGTADTEAPAGEAEEGRVTVRRAAQRRLRASGTVQAGGTPAGRYRRALLRLRECEGNAVAGPVVRGQAAGRLLVPGVAVVQAEQEPSPQVFAAACEWAR